MYVCLKRLSPKRLLTHLVEFGIRSKTLSAHFNFGPICRMNKCILTRSLNTKPISFSRLPYSQEVSTPTALSVTMYYLYLNLQNPVITTRILQLITQTRDMRRLTTGTRFEKCVVRRFHRWANVIECTYTNLDSTV